MKFLQKILFVSAVALSIMQIRMAYADQIDDFNTFAAGSWKSDTTPNIGGVTGHTIEWHLVQAFNNPGNLWVGGAAARKINLNQDIANYYAPGGVYRIDPQIINPQAVNSNPQEWVDDVNNAMLVNCPPLATNDSPRQWMRNLNLREIYRFKEMVILPTNSNLINNANYATDDLVKARALSGTFWIVDTTGTRRARRAFGGILIPNQVFGATYHVHTCMHGFSSGNATNNTAYYFVPYGVMASDTPENANYVVNKGFKVTHIHQGATPIDGNPFFQTTTPPSMNNTNTIILYSQNDYAMVTINGNTKADNTGDTLKNILNGSNNPIKTYENIAALTHLPSINVSAGAAVPDNGSGFDPNTERLFVVGYNSSNAALDHGIAISTTLTNFGVGDDPRRSVKDDQNIKVPPNIQVRNNEYFSSLATFPGISGGPVLRCRLGNDDGKTKKCSCIGTVFGAERKFTATDELEEFANFTNKK